ncbi:MULTISPECIES: RICIN domain-containing protein [Streptomyces]|uniref:Ricin B lectin n=1 Tax=Streptomyces viridochromogenes TaxID=1938 RepID=A0A0L8J4H1_STRVR|nr:MULTISPECIES: RICIN domain-containing protein [Streptomyces]KOG08354.1 ricin B lectin [Streptomyces viridochromogenes]
MTAPRTRLAGALAAAALVITGGSTLMMPTASAETSAASYTVTVGAKGSWTYPDDTPAGPYIDKDGTFYFQQAHALYSANDPRKWNFFTGTNIDSATKSSALSDAVNPANSNDRNNDTTWRCNYSPTGVESTPSPVTTTYAHRNYCDLAGVWVDPDTGDWYGLVHNEFTPEPFGDGSHFDGIDYAVSSDQGRTWSIKDHVITSPYSTKRGDTAAFPQQTYHYGTGDPRLFVDTASGYFYAFYGSRIVNKGYGGGWAAFYGHVARAPISSKMAPSSWQKWYNGAWSQPGVGGRESNMVPVGSGSTTGYTPTSKEYNPANSGSVSQQVAAGLTPPTSPLFVMDITYNAHLGLYIGQPQAVDQSGNASQEIYATDNLATQKWFRLGDTGSYKNASWYRWFLDSANKTSSTIVGKDFRSYCSFGCSNGSSSEYVNLTINTTEPAAPVDTSKAYRIAAGGRVLAQVSGSSATTSLAAPTGSGHESWIFIANGDGSHRIANSATGQLLGVSTASTATRAWGTKPTVTPAGAGGATVGQQWFVIRGTSATGGTPTGTYKIVNRYSGLVIGLSSDSGRLAETTPTRSWTNTTGDAVGGTRTAGEQTLTLTPIAQAPTLDGTHTLTAGGKALDNPDHSTTAGTRLITWAPTGGANQSWTFTRQTDGTYEIKNSESGLCADVHSGSTSAGASIIQWGCNAGANQRWNVTRLANGTYTVASVASGLLLTTASSTDGAAVTQQPDTGSALQQWTIN